MCNIINHLPLRPTIEKDESISGYFFRLVYKNCFNSANTLIKELGLSYTQAVNSDFPLSAIENLSIRTNTQNYPYYKHTYAWRLRLITSDWFNKVLLKNKIKYCPVCISLKHYHRLHWGIHPLHLCLIHKTRLQDCCATCSSPITHSTFIRNECEACNSKLENANFEICQNALLLESQKRIYEALLNQNLILPNIDSFSEYLKLAYGSFHLLIGAKHFIGMKEGVIIAFYNQSNHRKNGYDQALAYANVYWMYKNFPYNFYFVLNDFISRNKGSRNFYPRLKKFEFFVQSSEFIWLERAYRSFLLQKCEEGTIKKDLSIFN